MILNKESDIFLAYVGSYEIKGAIMKDKIQKRFVELLNEGEELNRRVPKSHCWVPDIAIYQSWFGSVANLLSLVSTPESYFYKEYNNLIRSAALESTRGLPVPIFQKMIGLLKAAKNEWDFGLLRKIEYIFIAETFDDFLDHASLYHKGNKKNESSVLASAVLEDVIKKIATKNDIEAGGRSLEPLIEELGKINIFTTVKAKRIKGYASVRNSALHAEWDKFEIRDVGEMISGIRDLIENFL